MYSSFQVLLSLVSLPSRTGVFYSRETVIYANEVAVDVTTRVVVEIDVTTSVVLIRLNVGTRLVRTVVVGISDTTVT
jgi:hypothetical protein